MPEPISITIGVILWVYFLSVIIQPKDKFWQTIYIVLLIFGLFVALVALAVWAKQSGLF